MIEIAGLVSAIDYLIRLLEFRDASANQRFAQLFEPCFNDLLVVHRDYIQMFEQTRALIREDSAKGTKRATTLLQQQRIEFAPVREKLKKLLQAMPKMNLSRDEKQFVDALVEYFPQGTPGEPARTDSQSLLDKLESLHPERTAAKAGSVEKGLIQTLELIERLLRSHREKWSLVCEAYVPLKLGSVAKR